MMLDELITIIIPVYMVEQYLDKCVESVVSQTYSKLEIILVDDGSPDRCGEMCDAWAERDKRIRVIHKENGGLSDARNVGIDAAVGEYLMFVDSDDYIACEMVEKLYKALIENNAEMSVSSIYRFNEEGKPLFEKNREFPTKKEVISGITAIQRCGERGSVVYSAATCKLYKRELFASLRYPKGKIHEDEFLAHRLLGQCNRIVYTPEPYYFYLSRTGSIINSLNYQTKIHASEAFLDRASYTYMLKLKEYAAKYYWLAIEQFLMLYDRKSALIDEEKELVALWVEIKKRRYLSEKCTLRQKLHICFIVISPRLHQMLVKRSRRCLGK